MPKIPVDECPAGPEMDAAVAKALVGHAFDGTGEIENRDGTVAEFCKVCNKPWGYHGYDNYRRIENAWRLWSQLCAEWYYAKLMFMENLAVKANLYQDSKDMINGNPTITAIAKDGQLAICRAFLKASGVEFVEMTEEARESLDERLKVWCTRGDL